MKYNGFILKAKQVVLSNLSEEHFGVKSLAKEMAVSRSELYKLVKKETGKSVTQFIREIRLEKALELLKGHEYSISDVSYMVGFSSPAYFTKRFKELYGFLPSDNHLLHQYSRDENTNPPSQNIFSRKRAQMVLAAITVVLVMVSVYAFWNWDTDSSKNSIAVLPFDDVSPNQDQSYFSDGISEAIINRLTQNRKLTVIGKTASFFYKDKNASLNEISKKLEVSYVLEGSVRQLGDFYQVTVQLIYTKNGLQVWSQTFDSESKDAIKAQEELADEVVEELEFLLL